MRRVNHRRDSVEIRESVFKMLANPQTVGVNRN